MLFCKYCNRYCKNKISLSQHEIHCIKNDNKISSNFLIYNQKVKNKSIVKINTNQFTKAKNNNQKPIVSQTTKNKIGEASKKQKWSKERRLNHSRSMIQATINHPDSYSSNNVCGRTKSFKVTDSFNNIIRLNGKWELLVSNYLNESKIKWTNIIEEHIYYFWLNEKRRYYPDFFLPEYNIYIEVKGYERERDLEKWKSIKNKLILIKKNEIFSIENNKYDILSNINKLKQK